MIHTNPAISEVKFFKQAGVHMVTYTAIPVTLPTFYRQTLRALGNACIRARQHNPNEYDKMFNELEKYEEKLRREFGVEVTREEFRKVAGGGGKNDMATD